VSTSLDKLPVVAPVDHIPGPEQGGLGLVRIAPFDVELAPDTVVQPDVFVVLSKHFDKITDNRILGAPDLVVEVASPGTAIYDRHNKLDAYVRAGVPEYWIVDTDARGVEVLVLEMIGIYRSLGVFRGKAVIPSQVVPGLLVQVEKFFM
jgi:Uma2 family endonuclease